MELPIKRTAVAINNITAIAIKIAIMVLFLDFVSVLLTLCSSFPQFSQNFEFSEFLVPHCEHILSIFSP